MSERAKNHGRDVEFGGLRAERGFRQMFLDEISDTSNYANLSSIKEQLVRREWTILNKFHINRIGCAVSYRNRHSRNPKNTIVTGKVRFV